MGLPALRVASGETASLRSCLGCCWMMKNRILMQQPSA